MIKPKCLFFFICFFFFSSSYAQKDNYWSWTFNTPSTLLGGAVVGGGAGPSAIYYNPALISREEVPQLSLSASIISLKFLEVNNVAGPGTGADNFIFQVQPRFISYLLPLENERFAMEFAILSPAADDKEMAFIFDEEKDIIQRTEGLERYTGYLKYRYKFDEWLFTNGFSFQVSPRFFIGGSLFVSTQLMKYEYQQNSQASQEGDSVSVGGQTEARYVALNNFSEELKYWDVSIFMKLGAQYHSKNERFKFGINLTTPNLSIYGEAELRKSFTRSNIYNNEADQFTTNKAVEGYESKVRTQIKTPFSASFGFQYITGNLKNSILLTLEYFHSIDAYSVFRSPLPEVNIGDELIFFENTDFMNYYHQAKSLTNFALGYKQYISEKFFLLGGFRTDFSSGSRGEVRFVGEQFKVNQLHLDKYHISLGPVIKFKNFSALTGIQYTYAVNPSFNNIVNFTEAVEYIPQLGLSLQGVRKPNASATMHEFSLFFGLILNI